MNLNNRHVTVYESATGRCVYSGTPEVDDRGVFVLEGLKPDTQYHYVISGSVKTETQYKVTIGETK